MGYVLRLRHAATMIARGEASNYESSRNVRRTRVATDLHLVQGYGSGRRGR
jgi:hypothetical protein